MAFRGVVTKPTLPLQGRAFNEKPNFFKIFHLTFHTFIAVSFPFIEMHGI